MSATFTSSDLTTTMYNIKYKCSFAKHFYITCKAITFENTHKNMCIYKCLLLPFACFTNDIPTGQRENTVLTFSFPFQHF